MYVRLRETFSFSKSFFFFFFSMCIAPKVLARWTVERVIWNLTECWRQLLFFQVIQFRRSNFCRRRRAGEGKSRLHVLRSRYLQRATWPADRAKSGLSRRTTPPAPRPVTHARRTRPSGLAPDQWRLPALHSNEPETSPGQWRSGRRVRFACT